MAYEPKDNTGSLFKNDRATTDKHPQATGSALIDGVEYFVDAWTNVDRNGNRYQSLKFKRKDKQPQGGGGQRQQTEQSGYVEEGQNVDLDDSIPFAPSWK